MCYMEMCKGYIAVSASSGRVSLIGHSAEEEREKEGGTVRLWRCFMLGETDRSHSEGHE